MAVIAGTAVTAHAPTEDTIAAVSLGRLAWRRLRHDRSAVITGVVLGLLVILAAGAPLWSTLYGQSPYAMNQDLLSVHNSLPLGVNGGMTGAHWLGVDPMYGRDILMELVYGVRTSLGIAVIATIVTTVLGVVLGGISGLAPAWVAVIVDWLVDMILAFPFIIFALAAIPIVINRFYPDVPEPPDWFRIVLLIVVMAVFGCPYTARLVRGEVVRLRGREFIQAARAAGATQTRVLVRELLPNLWPPILVVSSMTLPFLVTAEAALSYLGIGVLEPTPDLGRMVLASTSYVSTDPWYAITPGVTLLVLILAFNLFADSVRDALAQA
jgi:peptide/nickel transport system permease protein